MTNNFFELVFDPNGLNAYLNYWHDLYTHTYGRKLVNTKPKKAYWGTPLEKSETSSLHFELI